MGHNHSGFASTRVKANAQPLVDIVTTPSHEPTDECKTIVSAVPSTSPSPHPLQLAINAAKPAGPVFLPSAPSPSASTTIVANAPFSPSETQNDATTPYYHRAEYQQYTSPYAPVTAPHHTSDEQHTHAALYQHHDQLPEQSEVDNDDVNPYINGYVNPYMANLHHNVDIQTCTSPKRRHSYRVRDDSNAKSFAQLAEQMIPEKNKLQRIESVFVYKKQLGTGASSRVLLVEHMQTKQQYAMKELLRNNQQNHYLFLHEIQILNKLKQRNADSDDHGIVQIHDVFMDALSYYIVMEYLNGGNLLSKVISSHHFSEQQGAKYMKRILQSVQFLHANGVCHRDLKPNNVVFSADGQLKLIDFGQSEVIESNEKVYAFKQVGTTSFVPPEFHRSRSGLELQKGDVWSIGCVCFLLMCGKTLFGGNDSKEIWNKISGFTEQWLEEQWPNHIELSSECKDFIRKLLNKNVHRRLSVQQALSHAWIANLEAISDKHLGSPLLDGISHIETANKLQKILAESILSEMNENEIKLLMENIKHKEDIIEQLIKYHHSNYWAVNLDDKHTESHQQLMKQRAHHVMHTMTLMASTEFKLEDMDLELDLYDDAHHDDMHLDNKHGNGVQHDAAVSIELSVDENGDISNKAAKGNMSRVSVSEFRSIMEQSKKQYNVEQLIKELDPENTGFIPFQTIAHFVKPVKSHSVLPGMD